MFSYLEIHDSVRGVVIDVFVNNFFQIAQRTVIVKPYNIFQRTVTTLCLSVCLWMIRRSLYLRDGFFVHEGISKAQAIDSSPLDPSNT